MAVDAKAFSKVFIHPAQDEDDMADCVCVRDEAMVTFWPIGSEARHLNGVGLILFDDEVLEVVKLILPTLKVKQIRDLNRVVNIALIRCTPLGDSPVITAGGIWTH